MRGRVEHIKEKSVPGSGAGHSLARQIRQAHGIGNAFKGKAIKGRAEQSNCSKGVRVRAERGTALQPGRVRAVRRTVQSGQGSGAGQAGARLCSRGGVGKCSVGGVGQRSQGSEGQKVKQRARRGTVVQSGRGRAVK